MAPLNFNKLRGKHVLVIGGTSGIGHAVAEGALASDAKVTVSSSSPDRVSSAAASLRAAYPSRSIAGVACDLSRQATLEADLEALFHAAVAANGTIHHVVITAADRLSLNGLDAVTPEGVLGTAHMRMVVPLLIAKVAARFLPRESASSLTITSGTVSEKPNPGWAVVAFLAGGLVSLARALAVDLKPVRVNVVRPGYVDTGLWGEARDAVARAAEKEGLTGRFASVEDVAEAYLWLMKDGNVTGTVAGTDSGYFLA